MKTSEHHILSFRSVVSKFLPQQAEELHVISASHAPVLTIPSCVPLVCSSTVFQLSYLRYCQYDLSSVCFLISILPRDHIKGKQTFHPHISPCSNNTDKAKASERQQKSISKKQSIKEVNTPGYMSRLSILPKMIMQFTEFTDLDYVRNSCFTTQTGEKDGNLSFSCVQPQSLIINSSS